MSCKNGEKDEFVFKDGLRFRKTEHGLVYHPRNRDSEKKHACPDCLVCQWCSDDRCSICRMRARGWRDTGFERQN